MKSKGTISVNEAIEEAISMGFRNRYVLHNNAVYSLLTNTDFPDSAYAIVESCPVVLKSGHKGHIHYIVLNNGQLGFVLDEPKKAAGHKQHTGKAHLKMEYALENSFRE